MRLGDLDALSAFVGDLRSTLHKEQSTFKAMTQSEFEIKDSMLLSFQYAIDNAPTVETNIESVAEDAYKQGYTDGWKERFGEPDERPHGKWIEKHCDYGVYYRCSNCHKMPPNYECDYKEGAIKTNFCPYCGADMRGEENE